MKQQPSLQSGEYEGNPIYDDVEGFYKIQIGDHIAYRYEILEILGQGTFA